MASAEKKATATDTSGEILVAWQKYKATSADELNLNEGDIVELIDTNDPSAPAAKRMKIDPDLDKVTSESLLDTSAARHKLSVKPRRTYASSRHSPTRLNLNARWLVRKLKGEKKEGYVPCQVLQSVDEPVPGSGLPGDATFRRQAVVKELVETEQEFVKDLDYVVQNYLFFSERERKVPRIVKDNLEVIFGNLKEIADFHNTVLMEGVRYYQNEPQLLGKAFLRLERDFDKHVHYCKDEPTAQVFLETSEVARDYFDELSHRLGDDKSITEHLKLPIQRINDYQLLLKELVRYTVCLNEDNADLQKALELMLSVPHRAQDDKFTSNIEGYRGSIYKLGRLLAHDWFSLRFDNLTKERYLFLFKARILICKVRRISDDRSVFQLKDIIRLPQVEVKDYPDDDKEFELIDKASGHCIKLQAHRENIKEFWLKEIREFASEAEESLSDDLLVTAETVTPPAEIVTEPQFPQPTVKAPDQSRPEAQKKDIKESAQKPEENRTPLKKQEEKFPPQNPVAPAKTAEKSKDSKPAEVPKAAPAAKQPANPKSTANPVEKPKQIETPKQAVEPKKLEPPKQAEQPTKLETPKQTEQPKAPEVKPSVETVKRPEPIKPDTSNVQPVSNPKPVEKQQATEPVQIQATTAKGEESKTVQLVVVNPKVTPVQKTASESKLVKSPSNICVGVELNVDKEDMSKKYARTEGYGDSSSYSRRSASSYSTEGLSSSRYGTDASDRLGKYDSLSSKYGGDSLSKYSSDVSGSKYSTEVSGSRYSSEITGSKYSSAEVSGGTRYDAASKYGTDSTKYAAAETTGTSKYEQLSAKYGRTLSQTESDGYGSTTKYRRSITDSADGDGYNYRRSVRTEVKGGDDNGDSYSYTRRSVTASAERSTGGGEDDDYGGYSSRRSLRSERKSHDVDDGGDYSYRKRSIKSSLDDDPDAYVAKIRGKTNDDDSGDYRSSYSRRYKGSSVDAEEDSSYARKKKSIEHDEDTTSRYKSSRTAAKEQAEENVEIGRSSKYSRTESYDRQKSSRAAEEVHQEESSAKSKYSRTDDGDYSSEKRKKRRESKETKVEESSEPKASSFMAPPEEKPLFVKTCIGSNIEPGQSTVFEVVLDYAPDDLTWLKDNRSIDNGKSLRYKTSKSDDNKVFRLEITDATFDDMGLYTAVAGNAKGKSTCSCQLIVHELTDEQRAELNKPVFLVQLKDTEVMEDTYLRFMVKIKGEPKPSIAFYKDEVLISTKDERIKIISDHSEHGFYELVIPDVKFSDAGTYKCVSKNTYGESVSQSNVTVTDSKSIFDDLLKETENVQPGEKPVFVWRKDGLPFEPEERFKVLLGNDEDSLALIFQHVRPEDAGLYTCVAQTSSGNISCSAELTVQGTVHQLYREPQKPSLIIEKRDAIVTAGTQAMIEMQCKGYPKPSVKLMREGKTLEPSSKYKFLYEDDETLSLVIKNVQESDAGKYEITAENELGVDTTEMNLIVKAPPKILNKIEDISIAADETLKMTVEIEGIPEPKVQFYKDGQEIKENDRFKIVKEGNNYSVVVSKTVLKDTGSYSVVAINELAQVSQFWKVDVYTKPKIIKKLGLDRQVSQGEIVELKLQIESKPPPEITWYKNDKEITEDAHYSMHKDADGEGYILKISGAVTTDSASYKVRAKNIYGTVEDDVRVDVKCAPKITKHLQNMTVTEHDKDVTFDVKVEAFPKPTVKWYLDEMEISETRSEFTRIESDDGIKLVINEVTSELSGQYSCKLSNDHGFTESSAKLTVNCKPRFIKQLQDMTVEEGATLHLEVEVDACPEPSVKWLRNGKEVSADARIKISRDSKRYENYNLAVNLVKYEDQGEYEVVVTNSLGTVSCKNYVTVHKVTHSDAIEETEEPPKKLKVQVVEDEPSDAKQGKKAGQFEIEEISVQVKSTFEVTEQTDLSGTPELANYENMEIIETSSSIHIEESTVPRDKTQRGKSVQIEELQEFEWGTDDVDVTETYATVKPKRGKSYDIEEVNVVENVAIPQTPSEEDVPQLKSRKSISATIEEAITVEEGDASRPKSLHEEDVPRAKPRKSVSATIEAAIAVDNDNQQAESKRSGEEDVPKAKVKKGISAHIEEAVTIEEIIEEKTSTEEDVPRPKSRKSISATIEEAVSVDEGDASKPKSFYEEDVPRAKPRKSVSATIEEARDVDDGLPAPKTPIEEDVPRNKVKRGISATVEEATTIEELDEPQTPFEENVPKSKLQRGISAQKERAVMAEEDEDFFASKTAVVDEEMEKPKLMRGVSATKEMADIIRPALMEEPQTPVEEDLPSPIENKAIFGRKESIDYVENEKNKYSGKQSSRTLDRRESQTAKIESVEPEAVPKITDSNIEDRSQYESLDVSYVVKGTANPPPTATWSVDGKVIKPNSNLRMTVSESGEEFRLDIKKLDMKDGGVYQCKLSNPLGEDKKQAKLDVIPEKELRRPKLKKGLEDQRIVKKQSVTFKAVVVGDPIPDATWYFDDKELTADEYEKYKIILETEDRDIEDGLKECTYSLTIPRTERSNSGTYKLKAKNKWGELESSAHLTIVLKPEIEGPQDVSVVPGDATEFKCIIQANPAPVVTWSKDDRPIKAGDMYEIIEDVPNESYKLIVKQVALSDEGYIRVTAKNDIGESTSEARMKILKEQEPTSEKPKFITGLTDQHVQHGGEITVMVRADGLPKPQIRWYRNDKQIDEHEHHKIETHVDAQVTSSLTISDYNEGDIGIYKVTAVNVVGEDETIGRISMLQTPPTFGKRLERSVDVNEGEPLELKAKIDGSPKPTVAWYKDGERISPDDDRIKTTLLPDGTVKLNIDKCLPGDSGAYKLVVKNANGETAGLCAVAINPKPQRPKFVKCIKDQKLGVGQQLVLEAQVTAYPPPEIKWLKDGVPIRQSSNVHVESHPDGKIALVVDVMKPENAGVYTLEVSNKLGEITGDAKVEIEKKPTKPEFTSFLVPLTVVEGFPVKMEVKAKGFPAPEISWYRNGAEVVPDNKHIKITDLPDGTSCLILDNCDKVKDALEYKAIARNNVGETETSAPLKVTSAVKDDEPEERPMFLHGLKDVITDEGQPLVIEAPFTGNPIPSVKWTKDGEPIEPSDRILLTCDGRKIGLRIDNAQPSDAGRYGVLLENPLGKDSSEGKASVHKVYSPPSFLQRFTDLQQLPNRDAKFPCRVSGVPQPEVAWYKDGEPIKDTSKYRIRRDGDACCLYVLECTPEDNGVYKAVATNKEGSDACEARLDVVEEIKSPTKIEPPTFLKKIGDAELYKGMTAKFTACATGIPEPEVEWYKDDLKMFPSQRIRMEMDRAGLLRLTISGIDQDDLGKYSCKIFNEHGSDICHAHLRFDDGMDSKPKKPMADQYTDFDKFKKSGSPVPLSDAPIISRMTDRRCTLSWKPSIPSGPRAPVTYQLEMLELPTGEWFTVRSGIRNCVCDVRNLEPFRDYKFRVRVENKYGVSEPSPYAVTHREKLEPEPPKWTPYLPSGTDFRPDSSFYFPKDFDIERPPHDNMAQAPRFLRQEHDTQYGIKDQNTNLFWFVYGYPKPKMTYYFNDDRIESGGRFDMSYTRNGQATLFINKMLDRDVGWYEAVASNEHGEARQRVRLEIAEIPTFLRRPDIEYSMVRGKARFEARIIGVPYPEIKWYRDWKPLAPSARFKIQFLEPDVTILTISDVIYKDEGLYSVSARNVAGSVSSSAMLHIEDNDLDYNLKTYKDIAPIKLRKKPYSDFYDLGDELGRGTQGITYHAVERINGRNYAGKMMHGRDFKPFMQNEYEMMNELRHRRLISLHDAYETDDSYFLVMELASGGELVKDYLLRQDYYTESDIAGYVRQLLEGLKYMHERGYGHMGLNIGDLLLSHPDSDQLKIADFGLARRISMGKHYPLLYGVPEYVSPECANGEGVGLGHDMWSVGIITHILLSGRSPFLGAHDRETLTRIKEGKWTFEDEWWSRLSWEARDFVSKLLVYQADGRMDVHAALRHPWLERADRTYMDEYRISSTYLHDYYKLYREWYDNASCRNYYRRRPLEGAFTHPSKMVYPPGERYTPPPMPRGEREPRKPFVWQEQLPSRSPLNYEIGGFKSESHYQNGPDTYLLQLRDVDFPVRLREYMKVAAGRSPGASYIVSDENGFDWRQPVIRERRRFTDIMDEEIDDERKARINRYGTGDASYVTRRLRHEIGSRLDAYAEAEAFLESKHDGRLPFFREKPKDVAMQEGKDVELTCLAVGEPTPVVQWFKSDAIVAESHRIKIFTDDDGRSHYKLSPALGFDLGTYKVVARNKIGQTVTRVRILFGMVPDEPDSPEASQVSDTEVLLVWRQPKHDGNSPVICYSLQYKLADDLEWITQASNIDHEFYLLGNLDPLKSYHFRLAAKNAIGWSEQSVPSPVVTTKATGTPKIEISLAMRHLQRITDSGEEPEPESHVIYDYNVENEPIEWLNDNAEDHYDIISEIYKGEFSSVLKAVDKNSNKVVIAKIFESNADRAEHIEGEFAALRSLRHERIACLFAAYKPTNSPMAVFILEKLQGADVLTYLSTKHDYTEQTVATIVTQILDGLQYLHWRGLCHLDLQPDNVVMSSLRSVQVKLVDLGSAHRVSKMGTKVPLFGHPEYVSPELLAQEPAFPTSDVWSLGVLTYVMLAGKSPFKGNDENETRQNILFVRYRFEHLFQEVTQEATRFVMLLFKRQPIKRPTPEECHENRWLLPTDHMIKKRDRAVFLGNRLKEYCEEYHANKNKNLENNSYMSGLKKGITKSDSVQEELLTTA